jgi:hypothetical protein
LPDLGVASWPPFFLVVYRFFLFITSPGLGGGVGVENMSIYQYAASEEDLRLAKGAPNGSYLYARGKAETTHIWPDWASFQLWFQDEAEKNGMQFAISQRTTGVHYAEKFTLVCRREVTGGPKPYERKTSKQIKPSVKVCEP